MTLRRTKAFAPGRSDAMPAIFTWETPDGAVVTIRPTCPNDACIAQEFVRELSTQSRYFRFMGTVREFRPQMLRRFVRIDHEREVALVAVSSQGSGKRQLGECRYAVCQGGDSCEFAVAVLDAWQRRGLGCCLMSQLIAIARIRGLKAMIGDVLTTNTAMLALAFKLGFDVSASSEGWSVRRVSLALLPGTR